MKKLISSILCIIFCIQLIGCFNYTEINKVTFATSIIFDIDANENSIVYLDCVRPYRSENESSDKGKRVMFQGSGSTALDAIRNINVQSDNKLNFSQVRAYIFTERVADGGIDKYLDLINNDQQFGFKPYMFIYYGKMKELVEINENEEDYLGLYLDQIENNNKKNVKMISTNVNDYITQNHTENKTNLLSIIELKEDIKDKKYNLSGGVLMHNNKIYERLEEHDTIMLNLLTKSSKDGTFTVKNPRDSSNLITLDLLNSKEKTDVSLKEDEIILSKEVDIKVSIGEIQGKLNVNTYTLDLIKKNLEDDIKDDLTTFFYKYKDKGLDILNVLVLARQNKIDIGNKDVIKNTNLDLKVNIIIDGSSLIRDSL